MARLIYDAFQEILEMIAAGESLEKALAAYPQFSEELRPLLEAARLSSAKIVEQAQGAGAQARSRVRMLQYAAQQKSMIPTKAFANLRWRSSFAALLAAVIMLMSSTGIWVASAQSLPGDRLYPLKRRAEDLGRSLVTDRLQSYELDIAYRKRRVDEVVRLLDRNRIEAVTFEGPLSGIDSTVWYVEQIPVIVHRDTLQLGPFSLGDEVQVQGVTTASNAVLATQIGLRRYHLLGIVQSQDQMSWVVADRRLDMSDALMDADIRLGSLVEVEVEVDAKGIHRALSLKILDAPTAPETEAPMGTPSDDRKQPSVADSDADEREFTGLLDNMSGSAVIMGGQTFFVLPETEIEGVLSPGALLHIEAIRAEDGSWIALEIVVEEDESEREVELEDKREDSSQDDPPDDDHEELEDPEEDESDEENDKEDEKKDEEKDDD